MCFVMEAVYRKPPETNCKKSAMPSMPSSLTAFGQAAQLPYARHTYVYKTAGSCKIHLTTYRLSGDGVRPVVLWIHGGALSVLACSQKKQRGHIWVIWVTSQ
jgi:hypothetical protein